MVRSVIYRLVDDESQVDDLAQQTFIKAFDHLDRFEGKSRFSTWIGRIALNKSRDYRRLHRRRNDVDIEELEMAGSGPQPEAVVNGHQREQFLKEAMGRLKERDRELIVLKYLCDYDYDTIANLMQCSKEAAKVRSLRARGTLKRVLENMGAEL